MDRRGRHDYSDPGPDGAGAMPVAGAPPPGEEVVRGRHEVHRVRHPDRRVPGSAHAPSTSAARKPSVTRCGPTPVGRAEPSEPDGHGGAGPLDLPELRRAARDELPPAHSRTPDRIPPEWPPS
ncbi:hypothetical protein K7G98_15705 [Saccharothrix sp. MB29]|nr:hypothetical protein [Saccharothrix sp. MB29]